MARAGALVDLSRLQSNICHGKNAGVVHQGEAMITPKPSTIRSSKNRGPAFESSQRPCVSASCLQSSSFIQAESRVALASGPCQTKGLSWRRRGVQQGVRCSKAKAKKKPSGGRPKLAPWPFEDLMMFWDVAMERWCEQPERTKIIVETANKGLAAYGRGAVLVRETVKARTAKAAGAGFGDQVARQRPPDDEQQFDSLGYELEYLPRWKLVSLSDDADKEAEAPPGAPTVVSYDNLKPMLSSLDFFRLVTLTHSDAPQPTTTATSEDGSEMEVKIVEGVEEKESASEEPEFQSTGEAPYKSEDGELLLLVSVIVDGQLAVGADVVRQVPLEDGGVRLASRDELLYTDG